MFGFEHISERHSMSSSYGPGTIDDEMRYMQHGDELRDTSRDHSEQIIATSVTQQMTAMDHYGSSYSAASSAPPIYDSSDYSVSRHPISLG